MPIAPLRILLLALVVTLGAQARAHAAPQAVGRSLDAALAAYESKDFRRAATLSRVAADRAQGVERESARYLEGLALYKAGDFEPAATALRAASASSDRFIAGQASITLGSLEIDRKRFDAAGHAYRRAAGFLTGDEARRAHSIAARCYDGAGMGALAETERVAAGEPRVLQAPAAAGAGAEGSDSPSKSAVSEAPASTAGPKRPEIATPRRTVTADDKPAPAARKSSDTSAPPQVAAVRYAIQIGAYTALDRANDAARAVRARVKELGVEAPRVIAKESGDGKTLHLVQFGNFPNRGAAAKVMLQFPRTAYKIEVYLDGEDQSE